MRSLRILNLIYDHPENPWCGGGGAGRAWHVNRELSKRHDIHVLCGPFPGARPQEAPFRVGFLGKADRYVASRLAFMWHSRRVDPRHYDLVVEEFSHYAPIFSRFRGVPVVSILQGRHGLDAIRFRGAYGLISLVSEYLLLPRRRSVTLVSGHLRGALHPRARALVIGQGADIPADLPPPSEGYVLFLGRLDVWHKGLDVLLRAWAGIPRNQRTLPLHIVGGGDEEAVRRIIRASGAEDVHLMGRASRREALEAIQGAAFLCMPSRMEGSPLVAYEAMALGKPVVATAIPALEGLIPHNEAGLQVPPEDERALSEAIVCLMGDLEKRSALSRGARALGRSFSWKRVAERQEAFYLEVVESQPSRRRRS